MLITLSYSLEYKKIGFFNENRKTAVENYIYVCMYMSYDQCVLSWSGYIAIQAQLKSPNSLSYNITIHRDSFAVGN